MKITMTVPMEGDRVSRLRGDELDLDDAEAQRLIDARFATPGWLSDGTPEEKPHAPAADAATPAPSIPEMHWNDVSPIGMPADEPAAASPIVMPADEPAAATPPKAAAKAQAPKRARS